MYRNFRILNNTSRSIAFGIIEGIVAIVLLILAFTVGKDILAVLLLLGIAFLCFSLSSIFTYIKCKKFGAKTAFKDEETNLNDEEKTKFKSLNTLIAIFMIAGVVLFIVGCIVLFIKVF